MSNIHQEQAAQDFAERWQGKGYEKGESQKFWIDLLGNVLGVEQPTEWIEFEEQVRLDHTSFIDGHIARTHVLIEQKSLGKDLRAPIKQSDGSMLSPFQQAKRYAAELPYSQRPRWIVTCNFSDFLIYDMEQPNGEPEHIELKNLGKEYYRLQFLVNTGDAHIQREMEISLKAGQLVGMLYDKLLEQYHDKTSAESLRSLNILCVRLVFCLYAEDAGVFPGHDMFHDYLASFHPQNVRKALIDLFRVLDTREEDRDPYMEDNLRVFPYVNGGLFAEANIEVPRFTEEIVTMLLNNASLGFDWSGISPTIFGAVFESTLNPDTRRSGGMHYTSIENIHKVIDPLFLDELRGELDAAQNDRQLKALQTKLASLTFLDPACGSGNFLTETYISLRRIENEIILRLSRGQVQMGFSSEFSPIKVNISQFYGIEINDFAVTVARTALWIAEHQMLKETQKIVFHDLDFLPLKSYNNIREGDALKMEWCQGGAASLPRDTDDEDACATRTSHFLDRQADIQQARHHLPHWHQDGKIQFVTFRLADSLPKEKWESLQADKDIFLKQHPVPWDEDTTRLYYKTFGSKIDEWIDAGYGSCLLREARVRRILEDSLLFYNGEKYLLHSYVIMPNHVHVLFELLGENKTSDILHGWKSYSASAINKAKGRTGTLWQKESFDRIVRDATHYDNLLNYIANNPRCCREDEYTLGGVHGGAASLPRTQGSAASLPRQDNEDVCAAGMPHLPDYIIGNPPFVGARMMSAEQKESLVGVFGKKWKNVGNLDFVCAWYKKAAELMYNTKTRAALVSTNSVCQGETVANLWQPLMLEDNVHIDFAHRTFRWDSESESKAHVHCVIVGFSHGGAASLPRNDNDVANDSAARMPHLHERPHFIFEGDRRIVCKSINAYLLPDGADVFVGSRSTPLCDVPQMDFGNMPNDAKGLLSNFTTADKDSLCNKYPDLLRCFRKLLGAEEYINNKERWCLWLKGADLSGIRRIPEIMERIEKVKETRAASSREGTRKMALYPYLFAEIRQPDTGYIIVPRVSSERRRYVPMGIVQPEVIVNDSVQIIPNATLYHFGILTSNVHMAWMRAVCGRLKSDYRYSKDVVYNNFPWPTPNDAQRAKIEETAQAILDARALYPDSSLADLYDEAVMPIELRRAHQNNDRAVMQAYGFPVKNFTEQDCVARLMEMYKEMTK